VNRSDIESANRPAGPGAILRPWRHPTPAIAAVLAHVTMNRKHGFIDARGNKVIPLVYEEADRFSEGLACVMRADGTLSFIDVTGKDIVKIAAGRVD
jgi:hypothetical protein